MRLLISGADAPLGACLSRRLAAEGYTVRPVGLADTTDHDLGEAGAYRRVDLRLPANVAPLAEGVDGIVHAQPHAPSAAAGVEGALLEAIARGTYVLVQAARQAGVGRLVLVSQLALYDAYPDDYLVEAHWQPRPRPEAASLAPWLAELVCREIARAGGIEVVALRLGALDSPVGTSADDAVTAVRQALGSEGPRQRYRWAERHVASGGRYAVAATRPGRRV